MINYSDKKAEEEAQNEEAGEDKMIVSHQMKRDHCDKAESDLGYRGSFEHTQPQRDAAN